VQDRERKFISEGALMSPEDLYSKMDAESAIPAIQLNHLMWHPRPKPDTPMLVVGGEIDTLFSPKDMKVLADFYGGELKIFEKTAHNLMMEASYQESAEFIHDWLIKQNLK